MWVYKLFDILESVIINGVIWLSFILTAVFVVKVFLLALGVE